MRGGLNMKRGTSLYRFECNVFYFINAHYERKRLNTFFHLWTHLGSAPFTIGITLCLLLISIFISSSVGLEMACSLTISHLPVAMLKKLYPRKRPYLVLYQTKVTPNPLNDHSFPSGHTTAIFAIVLPLILYSPPLALLLLPLALLVGISRVFLGLHYPSDVLAGAFLGSFVGMLSGMVF